MKRFWIALTIAYCLLPNASMPVWAGEIEDLKKDLAVVQAQMAAESARADAAASEIGRIRAVFPQLQAREKELVEKIRSAEEDRSKAAEKKTAEKK